MPWPPWVGWGHIKENYFGTGVGVHMEKKLACMTEQYGPLVYCFLAHLS
jgi:hypothetical protein